MTKISLKKISIHCLASLLVVVPVVSLAAGTTDWAGNFVPCTGPGGTACDADKLLEMVNRVIGFVVFRLMPIVATLAIVLAGVRMVINRDSSQARAEGKKLINTVVVGMIIIFSAYLIVQAIVGNFVDTSTDVGGALKKVFK